MDSAHLSKIGGVILNGFSTLIKNWGNHFKVDRYASFIIARKLRFLKELKKWNKEVFVDVKVQRYNLLGTFSSFDLKDESVSVFF